MPTYKAPQRDLQFVLHEVLNSEQHYASIGAEDASRDMVDAIVSEAAKFCEEVLSPLNAVGDQEGCTYNDGDVTTPTGFKEAYQQWVESGWPSLNHKAEFGGQGLPDSIGGVVNELVSTANWAWGMYPGLSHGAMNTIELHGTDEQKEVYLSKLVSGEWTGTMCLTEAHCGSDLGLLKTKAEPNDDGSFAVTGSKIFISSGEHDMADNIVHITLARLPGAPEGTKGISLFIVPKFLPDGTRNTVKCGSIEHKMGIHGNSTCVMNFDGAKGFLIGPENQGLRCMFTFMNFARLGTAMQGVASAELSFQGALEYAKDRLAMRSLTGAKAPEKAADPIIVHPDVRRMLLTQKAIAEGGRAMMHSAGFLVDQVKYSTDEAVRSEADELLGFLTPIAKAFLTEAGTEAANLGVQVYGGHGFIQEWGMEQIVRDNRISQLYEGTTGIQALDLLGRKVLMTQGESLKRFTKMIHKLCKSLDGNDTLKPMVEKLSGLNKEWGELTMQVGMKAMQNRDEVGGASVDFLMYSGYVSLAYYWLMMANTANEALAAGTDEEDFYKAKIKTAEFYFARILPRTESHKTMMLAGVETMMALDEDHFAF
jgi:alkylation response protein AidB-like acyl-CoA dehydrogenase